MAVLLMAIALFAVFAACGGSDKKDKTPEAGDTPAAEQSPTDGGDGGDDGDEVTPDDGADGGDGVGAGGDAFSDVPLPDGADEVSEVTISGQQFPFFVPTESGVDSEAFGEWTMKEYDVDASVGDVVDFYKDNQGDWDEAYAITSSDGGLIVWASDDSQRAVWLSIGEGSGGAGTTSLVVIYGEQQ
jgi:hypothetical protein